MVGREQMLVYSVMAIVLSNLFTVSVETNVRGKIRRGNVAVDYIKPVNVFLMYFAEDIGSMVTALFLRCAPILLCSALFIAAPRPASFTAFILFAASSLLSYLILWLISALVGLMYFKAVEMGPVGTIKDYLIMIFSGSFVPIWFFPEPVQKVLEFLPFIYTYQLPLGIYIGRTSAVRGLKGMLIQLIWVAVFLALFITLKRKTERNIFVQGG